MSVVTQHRPSMSAAEFLAWEAEQEDRYEFVDGQPRLMAGGTHAHHMIALNIAIGLRGRLAGPCNPLVERKLVTPQGNYRYPDVLVDCGKPTSRDLAADEPRVVFEVESPSNTTIDEMERMEDFQSISTIQQIVIVSQTKLRARIYTRDDAGWRAETIAGEQAALDLSALGCTLPLTEIYDRVEFEPPAANA